MASNDRPTGKGGGAPDRGRDHTHAATFSLSCRDTERASVVASAVAQEAGEIADERSGAAVECDGETVRVTVTAADLVGLRAGANTWTGLLDVAVTVAGLPGDG
ncbi:MAG: KEOPS complex subunit Pcc1 [Halobacteriaceae archaeon]